MLTAWGSGFKGLGLQGSRIRKAFRVHGSFKGSLRLPSRLACTLRGVGYYTSIKPTWLDPSSNP